MRFLLLLLRTAGDRDRFEGVVGTGTRTVTSQVQFE